MRTIKHFFTTITLFSIVLSSHAQITSFPYQEGFETDFGDWQQYTADDFDWSRNSGGTPTNWTGPASAYEGDWYAYAEANNHNNQTAGLYAIFDFNTAGLSDINFVFSYHMYCLTLPFILPDQMGTLNVFVSTDGGSNWTNVWNISTNQGNNWHRALIDLSAYTAFDNVYIGFLAQIGNGNRSDIAIDDIQVFETPPCTTIPYLETFDGSTTFPFGWFYDNLWLVNSTWPGADPLTGNHAGIINNTTGNGTLYSPCFDVSSNSDIHVRFYNYWADPVIGTHDGYFYGSPDGGITPYLIDEWHNNNPANEEGWKEYDISSWADGAGDLQFWWEIDRSGFFFWNGHWAFDHFEVKEGDWNYLWTGNTDTDWNSIGNWENNTVPDAYSDATIPLSPSGGNFPETNSATSANCRDLFIEAGSHLNIAPNTDLTVHNTIYNYGDASSLVIDADAAGMGSIIHNTPFVQGTVEQYITSERWHLVSSPISDAIINTYYDIYLKEYNEPTDTWTYLVQPVTMPMNVPQGYSAWASDIYTGTTIGLFGGTLNVDDIVINSLSYTPTAAMTGFNLIGNPYSCAIDWNQNWPINNISGWAVIYDNGTYRGWNPYLTGNNRSFNGKLDGIIPVTNGFWVRATNNNASLTIPASERLHSNQPFYKEDEESTSGSVRIVAKANNWIDEAVIVFHEEGTSGFDGLFDLEKLYNVDESPQIYSISGEKKYSVNVLGELSNNLVIPVGYEMSIPGNYSIEASEIRNIDSEYSVFLEDVLSGELIDLRKDPIYTFYCSPDDDAHRFNLHFSKSAININEINDDIITIYSYDKNVFISLDQSANCNIQIVDIAGKQVDQYNYADLKSTTLKLNVKRGYYVVRIITPEHVFSEKVFIK
ncbi:MAG: T9SS type A sorting domain-containing protein [Bacteroidales bacterium]|nr:T9SS type A sorting domain-containing protein [Bacteroidales bacterium]